VLSNVRCIAEQFKAPADRISFVEEHQSRVNAGV
jgi:hypothetical protein